MDPKVISGHGTVVISRNAERATKIQVAMVQAVEDCLREGVTDPEVIRARQIAAKKSVEEAV